MSVLELLQRRRMMSFGRDGEAVELAWTVGRSIQRNGFHRLSLSIQLSTTSGHQSVISVISRAARQAANASNPPHGIAKAMSFVLAIDISTTRRARQDLDWRMGHRGRRDYPSCQGRGPKYAAPRRGTPTE